MSRTMGPIAIGSDHAGLALKEEIVRFLQDENWEPLDVGTRDGSSIDYPDIVGWKLQDSFATDKLGSQRK